MGRGRAIRMLGGICRAAQASRSILNVSLTMLKDPEPTQKPAPIPIHPDFDFDDPMCYSHRGKMLFVSTEVVW